MMSSKQYSVVGILIVMLVPLIAMFPTQARAADLVDITVRIKCVEQVENPDSLSGDGDYYPEVNIDAQGFTTSPSASGPLGGGPIEDDTFCPDWRFTRNVDRTNPINITIRLWDEDDGLNGDNDFMDINPVSDKVELSIRFNAFAGTWAVAESDVTGTVARGDGDHGFPDNNDGRIAQIEFDIFAGTTSDLDGDGIPDAIENNGVRRPDGSLVADLKALGADPCRKTIVVWTDYMLGAADGHSHEPKPAAVQQVVTAFDQAPVNAVACPYGGTHKTQGIDFIYLRGTSIPEQAIMGLDDGFRAARNANFPPELRPYAHYAIFVHDQKAGSSSSGRCCEDTGGNRDFIVSLGSWRSTCVDPGADGTLQTTVQGDDMIVGATIDVGNNRVCNTGATGDDAQLITVGSGAADARVGTATDQAGTLMHELGHALGLEHGGDEETNYMPNYLSNMNYAFQFGIPRGVTPPGAAAPPRVLDYSRSKLADLDKTRLKESTGIGMGLTDWTRWTDGAGTVRFGSAAGTIDWDWSTSIDNGTLACGDGTNTCVNVNVNADDDSGKPQTVLTGFDDWQNLKYRAIEAPSSGASNAAPHPLISDVSFPDARAEEESFFAFFDPDLAATKTVDKADAEGGDALTYTVVVKNVGTGPATSAEVTDTFPSGQGKNPETRALGTISPDTQKVETFKLTVACSTADGTVLVNSAAVSGTDAGGGAEVLTTNNSSTAATTIHAPKLQVSTTARGTGRAGETITYAVVVTNMGSAPATNVVVQDVVPQNVYYSPALDLGVGPKPQSVTYHTNGTTTLGWNLGLLAGGSSRSLEYTVRPSLLFLGGEFVANAVEVTYQNAKGCIFAPVRASASTLLTIVAPSRNPQTLGFWRNHQEMWLPEMLARLQATDQRFDTNGDGELAVTEIQTALAPAGNMDAILKQQMIATGFNLATRRINAATALNPKAKLVQQLGLTNVRDAAVYAKETLPLPVTSSTRTRYSNATTVLDDINSNKIEAY